MDSKHDIVTEVKTVPVLNNEKDVLQKLGYQEQLKRSRGLPHILFMTLAIMAVPFGVGVPLATSIVGGGPVTILWGWVLVSLFTFPTAFSLAELCALYPTSAGAYYWTYRLSPPQYRRLLTWINGWLNLVGVWTVSLSVTFGSAQLLVAALRIYYPDLVVKPWMTYLIFLAMNLYVVVVSIFLGDWLPTIDIASAVWMVLGVIVLAICLSVKAAAGRHSAKYVFTSFDGSLSGWPAGWTFFVGLLGPAYTYSAIGMIASMAEEVRQPSVQVPQAIIFSIPLGFLTGIVFLLPILFTLPDLNALFAANSEQPLAALFTMIMGTRSGGIAMWAIIFVTGLFCAVSIACAASRTTWAFARDKALPLHNIFATVRYFKGASIPINALLLSTVIQVLLGLLYLGSSSAFNAFVGVGLMCLGASYTLPILVSVLDGRRQVMEAGQNLDGRKSFTMGKWKGFFMNCFCIVWILFEVVVFSMPAVRPVTVTSMNYASVVFVGFAVISAAWYLIHGRHHFTGPTINDSSKE